MVSTGKMLISKDTTVPDSKMDLTGKMLMLMGMTEMGLKMALIEPDLT
ncbi:unannotated protein [freshwater metagenome]|uniref:Unannotated protein n=1 Tax=freshwater metagenome TaxID=449393 RepID=A0A6J7UCR3_9ZZZZ